MEYDKVKEIVIFVALKSVFRAARRGWKCPSCCNWTRIMLQLPRLLSNIADLKLTKVGCVCKIHYTQGREGGRAKAMQADRGSLHLKLQAQ